MAGYLYFTAALLLLTGLLLIATDTRQFKREKMSREYKVSLVLGWINIILSVFVFTANWAYFNWFW